MDYAIRVKTIDELRFILTALVDNGYSLGSCTKTVDDYIKVYGLQWKVILIFNGGKYVGGNSSFVPEDLEEIFMDQFQVLYCKGKNMKTKDINLPDFMDAKVGDKVYCRLNGFGTIVTINASKPYSIIAEFENNKASYTIGGKLYTFSSEPTLFYVDGENRYCIERPIPSISGSIVPVDAKALVSDKGFENCNTKRYFAFYNFSQLNVHCFSDEYNSFNATCTCSWKYAILGEDITVDGITYLKGTRVI